MQRIFILLISLILLITVGGLSQSCSERRTDSDIYLARLDSLLERHDELERIKLLRIGELRQKREHAASLTDQYIINSLLVDEFSTYNSDSAMKYVDMNLDIARTTGNKEWETKNNIIKSNLLAGSGLLGTSEEIMKSIDPTDLPEDVLTDYYGQLIFLYSHLGNYTGGSVNDFYIKERAYKDSIVQIIRPDHPDYLWFKGWDALGTDKSTDDLIESLSTQLASSDLSTRKDAKDAYVLAKLYEQKGDHENFRKYMTISGIADVKMVNAEISSLEDLAKIMFNEGDIMRAYKYINYSLNKAISYPNRVKAYSISNSLDAINRVYQQRELDQQRRTRFFLILACALAAVLTGAIATIFVQNTRLRRQGRNLDDANKSLNKNIAKLSSAQEQLNEANERLQQLNYDLKLKNDELNEANYVKEEYIGYIFTICSNYIGKLEDLKKAIHIKAVTKKYKEIVDDTADLDMKDELKEFYQSFDSVFLHIYPNFVSDFNSLLQDDKKIIPREGELLNTELRIYALVRLGITDSVKIAEFLHCSVQTVYNNRFRVRNKALVPKKDFAESVRTLGHYMPQSS